MIPSFPGTPLVYVSNEDLFDVVQEIHLSSRHGGRDAMHNVAKQNYANVTKQSLQLYADLCPDCKSRGTLFAYKIRKMGLGAKSFLDFWHFNGKSLSSFLIFCLFR